MNVIVMVLVEVMVVVMVVGMVVVMVVAMVVVMVVGMLVVAMVVVIVMVMVVGMVMVMMGALYCFSNFSLLQSVSLNTGPLQKGPYFIHTDSTGRRKESRTPK